MHIANNIKSTIPQTESSREYLKFVEECFRSADKALAGRKPSLRHMYVWGCPAEARVYNPQEKKLDSRTVSGYIIGYLEKSKGYVFYYPNHSSKIVETNNERFIENGGVSGSVKKQSVDIKDVRVNILLPTNVPTSTQPNIISVVEKHFDNTEQHLDEMLYEETNSQISDTNEPQEMPLRKSQKKAAKRFLRYLKETKDYMLMYRRSKHLEVVGYSNSDFAGCIDTRKSIFGYLFQLAEGAISWKSDKQPFIATSTMEAEFVACFEATIHALWLQNFISGFGVVDTITKPLKSYCDNSAVVFFSKNDKYSKGAKYTELKYFTIKEEVQK
uniref:Retroviral polymerase SH3-like domain-containing protein n=1 Tax=Nicotiana tabacum TaxID=4097 RepID=A0A1S4B8G4_TOBAC|nr:PREDICTED: uncharacterized protein LOC107805613 [Nicotiana tabacum]